MPDVIDPPTSPDTAAIAPTPDPAPEASSAAGATKRKLGLGGWIAASWLILMVLVGIVGPLLVASPTTEGQRSLRACGEGSGLPIYDPLQCRDREAVRNQRESGSADSDFRHLTGVDSAGRDVFSRVLLGTRTTLLIGTVSIAGATLFGGFLGLVAGYFRKWVDGTVSIIFDVMIAFPPLVLALMLVLNFAGRDPDRRVTAITFAILVVATPILGRISRVSTLAWSQREFVTAAKALGAKPFRIIFREVLPNVAPAMMSIAMLGVGIAIVTESSLGLIGLGVGDNDVSWGAVVSQGGADFRNYPHLVFVPSVPIVVTVCCLNFLGDALRRKFDVREAAI